MKGIFYLIILVIVALLGATFALKNPQSVDITYYGDIAISVNLTLLLAIAFVLGLFLGWLFSQKSVVQAKMQARSAKKEVKRSAKQIEELKSLADIDGE